MAKELPYFKFEPNQWDNGNIQMLSREDKGLFVDLCSMYWSRLGDVPLKLAVQKLCAGNAVALNSLCDEKIIEVLEGNIFIKFLSEQLNEFDDLSKQNSKNAKEGWEKRRKQKDVSDRNATALNPQCENDAIREEKRRENKSIEKYLMSEIKISNDKKSFNVNDCVFETTESEILYFQIAEGFRNLFIKNLKEKQSPTSHQEKAVFKSYVNPIRLMIEKKEATVNQLRDAHAFLSSLEGEFWKSNILSTDKLRSQIAQILAKKNTKVNIPNKNEVLVPNPNKRKEF